MVGKAGKAEGLGGLQVAQVIAPDYLVIGDHELILKGFLLAEEMLC
jgi:hypothetical protein